jgi:NADH:ubiquinone oxidoreductase subunit F (NADH-binding)
VTLGRVFELTGEAVIAEVRAAGLRERGGAGRPLAERWQAVGDVPGDGKVVICNAVDGDPRSPVARFVLQTNPGAVLEGLLVAAHAVGAVGAVVCLSAEYGDEAAALEKAVSELTSGAACAPVRIEKVPASLVSGEETALIRALEGRQALPYLRATGDLAGLGGAPTLVETAEILAAVAALFATPTGVAAANKVVAVFGDVSNPRVLDLSLGTTIRSALEQAAGGPVDTAAIKAVQFGGPASRFLPRDALETPIDYEDLERLGAAMGWGGIEVFGDGRCGVEMARDVTARLHEESCGKCVFCREGTRQLLDLLNDVVEGRANEEKIELMHELGEAMKTGSICSVGWGAALPALSALELFPGDFTAHLEGKGCPDGGR